MTFLSQYGLFALETFTLVIGLLVLVAGIVILSHKPKPTMQIKSLNRRYLQTKAVLQKELGLKKEKKSKVKKEQQPTLFVVDFHGDIKASEVEQLRQELNAILSVATPEDEIMVRLESPGGSVNGYGLAAAQLQRVRDQGIRLTVCVDKIAASGGYLMACVANTILAAPFAIIGSIGVVAQMPNLHRWLQKKDIDVELLTAGEYKRTLTVLGENTDKARKKFQEDLELIHQQFKDYVLKHRKKLHIEEVATGEHWLAKDALPLHLVDELKTSDEYLLEKMQTHQGYEIKIQGKQSLVDKILKPTMKLLHPWS